MIKGEHYEDGYVHNCHLVPRDDQEREMFVLHEDGKVTAHLDGYAIIPIEEYERLIAAR